jgi:hypothetical protein
MLQGWTDEANLELKWRRRIAGALERRRGKSEAEVVDEAHLHLAPRGWNADMQECSSSAAQRTPASPGSPLPLRLWMQDPVNSRAEMAVGGLCRYDAATAQGPCFDDAAAAGGVARRSLARHAQVAGKKPAPLFHFVGVRA